ncbi:MAG: EscU/YscU/HrcU family type III secretion system export apparatus switch protein [Opitutales bacterium]|nr:EscU/YscU/HrcU family type III secretion system export apparatus switch protein [Opitutales bacterium]
MPEEQDRESKTEQPTEKRLKKAREEGNFPKAQEIQVVFGLIASFIAILFLAGTIGERFYLFGKGIFANLSEFEVTTSTVGDSARESASSFLLLLMPLLSLAVLSSILAGGLQSGFRLAPKALKPKGQKLNPIKNAKQKFGKQAYVKFGVDLLKLLAVAGVIAFAIRRLTLHPIFHTPIEAFQILVFIRESTLYMLSLLIVGVGLVALVNYLYQRHKVMGDLRMTRQEVKDEHKQAEGDQQVKSARKQMALKLMERQSFKAIPQADVVVTNPTHFAVALRYDRSRNNSPMIIAKGKNLVAQRIKEIARKHGVPMVENRPAAQALYKIGQPGKEIPAQLFQVVAEILAYVYRHNRSFFHRRKVSLPRT